MKGVIKAAGKAALKAGARKAATEMANQGRKERGEVTQAENDGGIRFGQTQSINDLSSRNGNGFGIIGLPDRISPEEMLSGGFNPFNIPPGVSISGAEVNKCGGIITFQNHLLGFNYGTWSIGWQNPGCKPPDPLEPKPRPELPGGGGIGGGSGNRLQFRGKGKTAYLFKLVEDQLINYDAVVTGFTDLSGMGTINAPTFLGYSWSWGDWSGGKTLRRLDAYLMGRDSEDGFTIDPFSNTSTGPFWTYNYNHGGSGYQFRAFLYGDWPFGGWYAHGILGIFSFSDNFTGFIYNAEALESYWEESFKAAPDWLWIMGGTNLWINVKSGASNLTGRAPYVGVPAERREYPRCRELYYGAEISSSPSDYQSRKGNGVGGGRGKKKIIEKGENMDCCDEILEALEIQDGKISRLLDLLDPSGAWPIKIPGQMIHLDDEKAKPLELKNYPELWIAQLATQNRLREVAAPPGAWPISFPKGIIEPMGKGNLKVQSIAGMLTAILRGLDAKLGPIVNEVDITDGTPLEPGDQKMSLRFFGLSSLACQILQIAIDNEGDIDLSNNLLLRLAMTSAATQKAATQSALQTSEILDALGAKMNDKTEDVPFFFNPQAAAEVAENLQNTEESTEALMAAILDTSTQKIKYLSVDEKRNIVMRLTQMEQAINTIQAGQAVEWDGSKTGLAALMSSYMLIDQIQDYKLKKELRNLDNQGDFGEWSKQHEAGYPETTKRGEYSDTSKPWGRDQANQPKIRKVDNNPDREQ